MQPRPLLLAVLSGCARALEEHPDQVEAAAHYLANRLLDQVEAPQLLDATAGDFPLPYEAAPFPDTGPFFNQPPSAAAQICTGCHEPVDLTWSYCPRCGGREFLEP